MTEILKPTAFREKILAMGAKPVGSAPAEFQKLIESEIQAFLKLGEQVKLMPD